MDGEELTEFLKSVSAYCQKYQFQVCHMCERMSCADNTNPLVEEIKQLKDEIKGLKKTIGCYKEGRLDPFKTV